MQLTKALAMTMSMGPFSIALFRTTLSDDKGATSTANVLLIDP